MFMARKEAVSTMRSSPAPSTVGEMKNAVPFGAAFSTFNLFSHLASSGRIRAEKWKAIWPKWASIAWFFNRFPPCTADWAQLALVTPYPLHPSFPTTTMPYLLQDGSFVSGVTRPACQSTKTRLMISCRVGRSGSRRRAASSDARRSRGRRTVTASVSTGGRPIFFISVP